MEPRQEAALYSRDVWLLADRLIACHGATAAIHAAERAQTLLEEKEICAALFWRQTMNAIRDWYRPEPEPRERLH